MSGKQKEIYLSGFAKLLRDLRPPSMGQSDVAKVLTQEMNLKASQSMIVQLESGRTKNPDPEVIRGLAKIYEVPVELLFAELFREKYGLDEVRCEVIRQDIKSIDELAEWELKTKPKTLWVIAPDFIDADNQHIFNTVKNLLTTGNTEIRYFINETDLKESAGKFWVFLEMLKQSIGVEKITGKITWTFLRSDQIGLLAASIVISEPEAAFAMSDGEQSVTPEGFLIVTLGDNKSSFGFALTQSQIRQRVVSLFAFVNNTDDKNKNVFPSEDII